jgi:hypothetical protein
MRDFEKVLFSTPCAFIYSIPPAGPQGHRAEAWNVTSWLKEVACEVRKQR